MGQDKLGCRPELTLNQRVNKILLASKSAYLKRQVEIERKVKALYQRANDRLVSLSLRKTDLASQSTLFGAMTKIMEELSDQVAKTIAAGIKRTQGEATAGLRGVVSAIGETGLRYLKRIRESSLDQEMVYLKMGRAGLGGFAVRRSIPVVPDHKWMQEQAEKVFALKESSPEEEFLKGELSRIVFGFNEIYPDAIQAMRKRTAIELSTKIWDINRLTLQQMKNYIAEFMATQESAGFIYQFVKGFLTLPDVNLTKKKWKQYFKDNPPGKGVYRSAWKNALRIIRTETNKAFREAQAGFAEGQTWVKGVKFVLSGAHPEEDICDEYAEADDYGLGPGVYPAGAVPTNPHPHCLCHYEYVIAYEALGLPAELGEEANGKPAVNANPSVARGHIKSLGEEDNIEIMRNDFINAGITPDEDLLDNTIGAIGAYSEDSSYVQIRNAQLLTKEEIALLSDAEKSGYEIYKSWADSIEKYIEVAPKFQDTIFRGITLPEGQITDLMPGAIIDMRGLSSWSSSRDVAEAYMSGSLKGKTLFTVNSPKSGTSIMHLSSNKTEEEVLLSSKARFEVVSKNTDGYKTIIELKEI